MGVFNPSPQKLGAERGHNEEALLAALLEADGTAFPDEVSSFVWAERLAEARCIAYLWHLQARFANQWDPRRMTDLLARWERIYGLAPLAGAADADRRAAVGTRVQLDGAQATRQVVADLLDDRLGAAFLGLVNNSSATALGSVPGGCSVPGGVTLPDGDWRSAIAYVAVLLTQPPNVGDAPFYALAGTVYGLLDDLLPAWVTFDWVRDGAAGAGFILDDLHNLDNERFDS